MNQPDDVSLVMDLTLIINSFFEIGFKPYTVSEESDEIELAVEQFDFEPAMKKHQCSAPLRLEKPLLKINRLRQFKVTGSANQLANSRIARKKVENLFETKKILEKEHLLKLNRLVHYWDIISIVFGELDSCRFASFNYEGAECCNEKAIGWILLILHQQHILKYIFKVLYSIDFVLGSLYDTETSYLWSCKEHLLDIAELLDQIHLDFEMQIIRDFEGYTSTVRNNSNLLNSNISKQVILEISDEECVIEEARKSDRIPFVDTQLDEQINETAKGEELKENTNTPKHNLQLDLTDIIQEECELNEQEISSVIKLEDGLEQNDYKDLRRRSKSQDTRSCRSEHLASTSDNHENSLERAENISVIDHGLDASSIETISVESTQNRQSS